MLPLYHSRDALHTFTLTRWYACQRYLYEGWQGNCGNGMEPSLVGVHLRQYDKVFRRGALGALEAYECGYSGALVHL